jgi:anti-anti-sigma factor
MSWSLSSKITLSLSSLLLALAALVTVLTFVEMRRDAIAEKQALVDVMNYTFEALLAQEAFPSLQRVVENTAMNNALQSIVIVDRAGVVLASSNHLDVGKAAKDPFLRAFLDLALWARTTRMTESTVVILQPLRGSGYLGGAAGDIAGVVEVTVALDVLEEAARMAALRLLPLSLGGFLALSVGMALMLRALVTKPVGALALVAQRIRNGERGIRSQIRSNDEVGLLSRAFDDMAIEIETMLSGLEGQVAARTADLEAERSELDRTLSELQSTTAARLALVETVRELSTPVIRIYEQIVVLPLIGEINAERARQIETSLLAGIERHRATEVLLDLTGVPFVDTAVAESLMRAARAAQLIGSGVTIVGISPRVAQSLVHLRVDFSGIATRANLQSGLVHALRRRNLSIRKIGEGTSSLVMA